MSKPGRKRWSPPDGVKRQTPEQTRHANAAPRGKRSVYKDMYNRMKREHSMVRPGYGKTGHLLIALLSLFMTGKAFADGPALRSCEKKLRTECRIVTSGTAQRFFDVTLSSSAPGDRKLVWFENMSTLRAGSAEATEASSTFRISTWAATADNWVGGWGTPFYGNSAFNLMTFPMGAGVPLFIRRGTGSSAKEICATQCE